MLENYILGLDIGIGSVGYGLIDENQNIIDAGVRLFPEADVNNNNGRREKRGARRLKRRKQHRVARVKHLLVKNRIMAEDAQPISNKPYEIRVKGLSKELTDEELAIALIHIAKRRGIHNVETTLDEQKDDNELSTKEQISKNEKLLRNKFVCELQLQRLTRNKENEIPYKVRGYQNRFKTSDYIKEVQQILNTQRQYNKKITDEFIERYIELIKKRREYFEGPGEGSEYGWGGDPRKWYEQLMGKCSYFPEELRAVKASYSAQLFNALNDLNNIVIMREENTKLSAEEKRRLIEKVFKIRKKPTLKQIAKEVGVNFEDIKGYRVNAKGEPIFTSFDFYHSIKTITQRHEIIENDKILDQMARILTVMQTPSEKRERLKQEIPELTTSEISEISELRFTSTHSLSLKLIYLLLPELWSTTKNHMQILSEMKLKPKRISLKGRNQIPVSIVDEWILSPVVKRAFTQSIRIVNAIIKRYGEPSEIVIELARERNSEDRKKFLSKLNRKNAAMNEEVKEKIEQLGVYDTKGLFEMIKLWHLQDGHCMYSLTPIPLNDLFLNPNHYEIDHIIPRSISFDDSINNKVLVKYIENQKKGNLTPYQYMNRKIDGVSYDKFKQHVLQLAKSSDKMSRKKREYLLEERDINKFEVQKEFINRNLVDTRYVTRELMNLLKTFFSENNKNVKIKSINGSFTHYLRKLWRFKKDRNIDYKHHAEDALIIAMAGYLFSKKEVLAKQNLILSDPHIVNKETGEILSEDDFTKTFIDKYEKVATIKKYQNYKYSHRVDQKPNRQLMNDTICSTRTVDNNEYVIKKIKDIYAKDNTDLVNKIRKSPKKLLMYHNDRQTYEKIKSIMEQYGDAKNPLYKYKEETGEFVTKYSKKDNGPPILSVKYYSGKLGEHKDITHKFHNSKKRVVNLSIKPFRMDVYKEDGIYKFVTVRFNDLKEKGDNYEICKKIYEEKLKKKKINNKSNFLFSLNKYDIFELDNEEFLFIGVNHDKTNRIECNWINQNYKNFAELNNLKNKQLRKSISKNIIQFEKFATDVLGNRYKVTNEKLIFSYPKKSMRGVR
ncbi:type II CRISPR RNA-guided endonuclease Cas9 [Massilibacterium senegalense]|uniref:type II CRISPR RNA-guided endonuclease Cas9 n=1 Tax=Massilibacterium senegalense TaxID=1632858 RepID=UPI000784CD62|nr:type II CRISPR RNA-guided endonuclease Cas9 [Massilibacterium senegalense]